MMMNRKQAILIEDLTRPEMIAISGGKGLKGLTWLALVEFIVDNWADIKQAAKDFVHEH